MARILLVDDDTQALESTRKILELAGYEVVTAADGQAALEQVRPAFEQLSGGTPLIRFDLVVSDVRMPRLGGLEFLRALSLCGEGVPTILMTAFGRVEDAVWAMKLGAVDFLTKPFKRQALLASVEAALKRARARGMAAASSAPQSGASVGGATVAASGALGSPGLAQLVGRSRPMDELRVMINRVAPTAATVLLSGESGTGKEMVARSIHEQSPRAAKGRFVALNCAAVPENLIESELFGFEKGAFTGATGVKEGLFEAANGGTLLLDEIGDMPIALQAKLLRTLQEGEVRRLGSTYSRKVDVRVIAASHRDLKENVRVGAFRQDLLYRLEVIGIHVPPLRERMEDCLDLAYHFLKSSSQRHEKEVTQISEEAMGLLLAHDWPGNVRELSNVIERAIVFAHTTMIMPEDLPPHLVAKGLAASLQTQGAGASMVGSGSISVPLGTSLKDVEDLLIRKTLEATSGDKNMTAKLLGINSRTIYRKLDRRENGNEPEIK
jgi:two-component system response regulator HydG